MQFRKIIAGAFLVSALGLGASAPASGAPATNPRGTCAQPGMVGGGNEDFFPKVGGCVSSVATGAFANFEITQAGYVQRCKQLEALFGGYPMIFEHGPRIDVANNKQECVALLKFFHGGGLGEE